MQANLGRQYQLARSIRETGPVPPPTEHQVQTLWFEQFYRTPLLTDEGRPIEIIQPGLWNHGSGPDFLQAAFRDAVGQLHVGPVEIHLQASDWASHGHDADPAYENTILHVVWAPSSRAFFPATRKFRRIPQVFLRDQLVAPWEHLLAVAGPASPAAGLPAAKPGLCQREFARLPAERALALLEEAGEFRLRQKAERLHWRAQSAGFTQALWEALAEGLGYHQNKIPFRLIAQRLRPEFLRPLPLPEIQARLFGIAGLLPGGDLKKYSESTRRWLKPRWELWWKVRSECDHAILPRPQWKLAGIRPLNRPERRLAALSHLPSVLPALEKTVQKMQPDAFADKLAALRDPFWERLATFSSDPLIRPCQLLGPERAQDLLINVFWPWIAGNNPQAALSHLRILPASENHLSKIARQRVLGTLSLGKKLRTALLQQGLLQIYQDYCLADASQCGQCAFPGLIVSSPR
jgi:hypothetical protein